MKSSKIKTRPCCIQCKKPLSKHGYNTKGEQQWFCNYCRENNKPIKKEIPSCRYCSKPLVKNGHFISGKQRWLCRFCSKTITNPKFDRAYAKVDTDVRNIAVKLYSQGLSAERVKLELAPKYNLNITQPTICRWWQKDASPFMLILRKTLPTIGLRRRCYKISINSELKRSLTYPMPEYYPFVQSDNSNTDKLVLAVNNAIPKNIPEQYRQDICQEILLAILEHKFAIEELPQHILEYIKKIYRQFGNKYQLSLDAHLSHDDNRTLLDVVAAERIINRW
jgi:hypothetical protein